VSVCCCYYTSMYWCASSAELTLHRVVQQTCQRCTAAMVCLNFR